jgi:hypothetical protein
MVQDTVLTWQYLFINDLFMYVLGYTFMKDISVLDTSIRIQLRTTMCLAVLNLGTNVSSRFHGNRIQ